MDKKPCLLILEDGRYFKGFSMGAAGETFGEVVFNTSMTGYQEILTDPSYFNQIVTMTYPHIGNYGTNQDDAESKKVYASGFVVKEVSATDSNWRSENSLQKYLMKNNIVGIQGIDTRALVKHIRLVGAMRGAISTEELEPHILLEKVQDSPLMVGRDLVKDVSIDKPYSPSLDGRGLRGGCTDTDHPHPNPPPSRGRGNEFNVAVLDFGIKNNIINCLHEVGCNLTIMPAHTGYKEVLAGNFNGLFLSNGPGDPAAVTYAIENIRQLLGKLPIFGICLGHQLLSLALGAKTYKLKFGHRGANHPVKNLKKGSVEITAQNHGFAVKPGDKWQEATGERAEKQIYITHKNLNDGTVEGISVPYLNAFSVQYHPESSPGPHDSKYLFRQFAELMDGANA